MLIDTLEHFHPPNQTIIQELFQAYPLIPAIEEYVRSIDTPKKLICNTDRSILETTHSGCLPCKQLPHVATFR